MSCEVKAVVSHVYTTELQAGQQSETLSQMEKKEKRKEKERKEMKRKGKIQSYQGSGRKIIQVVYIKIIKI